MVLHCTANIAGFSPGGISRGVERVLLHGQASTLKLIDPPLYHIKGKSVMKACWADMPYNCWGEHCIEFTDDMYCLHVIVWVHF